ncbi:MAG: DUF1232 domain-containing protein [Myxococcales bacterium]|nr:DUF1232 domain-containing protein [Myxococcales bacterium]
MNEMERQCLDAFPEWLRALADDARDLSKAVADTDAPPAVRAYCAAALNYLFKSLDLISDGIEDLGYLDDAFVLRVAAALALDEAPSAAESVPYAVRLAGDAKLVAELLGADYARLETYVKRLRGGAARGRTVDEILANAEIRAEFLNEVDGWAKSYDPPSFVRDEKNLVKLKSFLATQLP